MLQISKQKEIISFIEKNIQEDNQYVNRPINEMNDTILHFAAYKRYEEVVKYLVKKNANAL